MDERDSHCMNYLFLIIFRKKVKCANLVEPDTFASCVGSCIEAEVCKVKLVFKPVVISFSIIF